MTFLCFHKRHYTNIISQSSGTSFAAPQVTNLAATLLSIAPKMSPALIKKYLIDNADKKEEEGILLLNPKRVLEQVLSVRKRYI